jgi:hypothetical protein
MTDTPRLDDLINTVRSRHEDDALAQLSDAVLLGEHLGSLADHLIGHFVDQARRSGASWTQIGQSMGVTKQAAQKRFVPREDGESDLRAFARYNGSARQSLVRAQKRARTMHHDTIRPEHLALGLFAQPDTVAGQVLPALGVSTSDVRDALVAALGPGGESATAQPPFTPAAKGVLEAAHREAGRRGDAHIGTEHLVVGVAAAGIPALDALGLTVDAVTAAVDAADATDPV